MVDDLIEVQEEESNNRNAFGALDALVINAALVTIAAIPTVLTSLFLPWRLTEFLKEDKPKGYSGYLLGPGLFFLVAVIASVLLAGLVYASDESVVQVTSSNADPANTSFFGIRESTKLAQSVIDGNLYSALIIITPLFLLTVFSAAVSQSAKLVLGEQWPLKTAIRAWLYFFGTTVSLIFVAFAIVETFFDHRPSTLSGDVPMMLYLLYFFGSIFLLGFKVSVARAFTATLLCGASMIAVIISLLMLVRA